MYLLVVFLPLIGAFTAGFFGRYLGKQGSILLTTLLIGFSSFFSVVIFYEIILSHSVCTLKAFF